MDFIQENWQFLTEILLALIVLVMTVIRHKVKFVDSLLTYVIEALPVFINVAEKQFPSGAGSDKLDFVCQTAQALYNKLGGKSDIKELVIEQVEKILSTPVKKEDL